MITILSNLEDPFYHYLPTVQKVIDSFELTTQNRTTSGLPNIALTGPSNISQPTNQTENTTQDPWSITEIRLARGEIPIEEYERLSETLEC
jgi:hypothetical protein